MFRIDAITGQVSVFARLPNYSDPNLPAGQNMPALGNISYDGVHNQFFVSDPEDGRIYRIKAVGPSNSTGVVMPGPFDHGNQESRT